MNWPPPRARGGGRVRAARCSRYRQCLRCHGWLSRSDSSAVAAAGRTARNWRSAAHRDQARPVYSDPMGYGWHDSLGPSGPSLDLPKFEEARRRRRPPRARWLGAATSCFWMALGTAAVVTQSHTDAHWVLLAGGGLWLLAGGLLYVWRKLWRLPRADRADASTRSGIDGPLPSPTDEQPSWWLQPMSRTQATILGLPLIAAPIAESVTDSNYVTFAWALIAGGSLVVTYLGLAYLRSERSESQRRFRPAEDDSRRKWRRYRWPRGALAALNHADRRLLPGHRLRPVGHPGVKRRRP